MKILLACAVTFLVLLLARKARGTKSDFLVIYFSWSGFTEAAAKVISQKTGGLLLELEPIKPYPEDYSDCVEQAKIEQSKQAFPEIKDLKLPEPDQFGPVFLGYPNWWGSIPRPVASFLKKYSLDGRTVIPFCTHGGGGAGRSLMDLKILAPEADFKKPLVIRVNDVASLPRKIEKLLLDERLITVSSGT
ncbi:MAG: hypothetical protein LBP22_06405 [Deltaproteobacteria bacterium]|jgi:flavodoxin|nr:hypothetical protein [Deltaproteobacteria bacterium]